MWWLRPILVFSLSLSQAEQKDVVMVEVKWWLRLVSGFSLKVSLNNINFNFPPFWHFNFGCLTNVRGKHHLLSLAWLTD